MSVWNGMVLGALATVAAASSGLAAPGYHLESAVKLAGPSPSWDYVTVDPVRPYVFLGRRAQGVTVYDTARGAIVAQLDNSQGANVARLVPEVDRGYTANEDGSTTV